MKSSDNGSGDDSDPWSKLTTNKTFDAVDDSEKWLLPRNSAMSTDEVDGINKSKLVGSFNQTTPYSLLVQSLIKQLCHFLETDKERSAKLYNKLCAKLHEMKFIDESYERSEFENIRLSYELALKQLVEATRGNTLPMQELEVWPLTHDNPKTALEWSRYFRDFEEIEKVGEGGFGDVWKSKHKLDGIEYAIKKICVKATSVKNVLNHLREVKTLASLNHINIVPYRSCWLEPLIAYHKEETVTETFQSSSTDESSNNVTNVTQSKLDSLRLKSDSFSIDFQYSHEQKSQTIKSTSTVESHSQLEKIRQLNEANGALIPHVKLTWAVLYIQMKLCQKTLRHFLDERNEHSDIGIYYHKFPSLSYGSDGDVNGHTNQQLIAYNMFHQLCGGLEYIHTKGIVHHDIKPSNVFISDDESGVLTLQLGDFGLACPLEGNDMVRHDGFGTRLYAATEQLDGQCCKKSDIYSLGVILIELLSKCVTVMECFIKVEKLKKGENLSDIDSDACELIRRLLSQEPKRPDIGELRQIVQLKLETASNEVIRLKRVISDKDSEIQKKDLQIDELNRELESLRKQLSIE